MTIVAVLMRLEGAPVRRFFIRRTLRKDGRTRASNVYIGREETIISGLQAHRVTLFRKLFTRRLSQPARIRPPKEA